MNYSPLLTDFYQLTMAYGYWKLGMENQRAAFHLLFRSNPFKAHYALNCGLGRAVRFIQEWAFTEEDIHYLQTINDKANKPLFSAEFLQYLLSLKFTCDIAATPEGTIVFPNEPLLRIEGPLLQCQLLETALLNIINFQTLIATKASRVCFAAGSDPVIEFGMRRAQGPDGALSASRAAYIGGCVGTSNTLAGKLYDIPVRGTHAHSWVTAFDSEPEAFAAYASILPQHCVLLVDTYHTLEGVAHAIEVGKQLRKNQADLLAVRLDSGEMAELSIAARKMLDAAGFKNTGIIASNSLDEYEIERLKQKNAKISSWGVGTHLATAYDCPALDGVYKMSALQDAQGIWQYKLKLSEQTVKISNPGRHQVRRFFCNEQIVADVVYDLDLGISDAPKANLFDKKATHKRLDNIDGFVDLLIPVFKGGKLVQVEESIHQIRDRAVASSKAFLAAEYHPMVGLEEKLYELKLQLIQKIKNK